MHKNSRAGFTLVELSVVLVIIALIVGGILVGRDMIEQSRQRQFISEIEKVETAVNTFKNKYACIPGDCTTAQSNSFGFDNSCGGWGAAGNGVADSYNASPVASCNAYYGCQCEAMFGFGTHLSQSRLVQGNLVSLGGWLRGLQSTTYPRGSLLPVSFSAYGYGKNWLILDSAPWHTGAGMAGTDQHMKLLSSNVARSIDGKADDGKPLTGKIQAAGYEGATGSGPCVTGPAGGAYNGTCIGYNNMGCATGNTATSDYALSDTTGDNLMWQGCKIGFRTSY